MREKDSSVWYYSHNTATTTPTGNNNNNNQLCRPERGKKNEYVQKSELRLYFWGVFSEKE